MLRVAIAGASGYTGFELIRLLSTHPRVVLSTVTSRTSEGQRLDEVYPAFRGHCHLTFHGTDPDRLAEDAELVFTALPHRAAMGLVPELLQRGLKVVDLSADFRFRDAALYEMWYQEHTAPHLLSEAVYGLPELYRDAIRTARLVGNPGCYPTSIILAVAPLLAQDLIVPETILADSKSAVSGAGRGLSLTTHFCEVNDGLKAYKIGGEHRHTPEIEQELSRLAGRPLNVTFTPHLVPMSRGILSTVYAELKAGTPPESVDAAFASFYRNARFVRLCGSKALPSTLQVRGSNYCDLGWKVDIRTGRVIVVSAIDNLTRGASGQAVCNMNLMAGFEEDEGLREAPWQP
ncbi:N-acetyl-gamma-glutamyl-phosphate reductase [Desulfoglaeba alkanexedens]|jgi:N-acetyl-gamma-glutamyl-phosphate reductase|uniref:N-acetyl-gamma-glutamyl-phosphate reductase n=1 Tax=Desulfoglaeba alkanexedens ALDC TaxID=980445 RepID=A0A4P8KZZ5_9BACT|nr:N-acetyl-gamma-glutamyl-phosphate reductase [Desulfoglaeba alkanexedens]QCQ21010.1 N-acetyl-gamma-glutamyl-phosphate reductase [Desulfoglaeba alkanexedens ALDC]